MKKIKKEESVEGTEKKKERVNQFNLFYVKRIGQGVIFEVLYRRQEFPCVRIKGEIEIIGYAETFDLEKIKEYLRGANERKSLEKEKALDTVVQSMMHTNKELFSALVEEREKEKRNREERIEELTSKVVSALSEERVERQKIEKDIFIREPKQ